MSDIHVMLCQFYVPMIGYCICAAGAVQSNYTHGSLLVCDPETNRATLSQGACTCKDCAGGQLGRNAATHVSHQVAVHRPADPIESPALESKPTSHQICVES